MKNLLIDGDGIAFQLCIGLEHEVRWSENLHTLHSNPHEAIDGFLVWLREMQDTFAAINYKFAFTGSKNFRKGVDNTYKFHRKKTRKPLAYSALLEFIEENYDCTTVDELEADDLLGIWQTDPEAEDTCIISDDKDLLTIPGRVYRLGELHTISRTEADYYWLKQSLTGDTADGYKGCPGVGEKAAEKLLSEFRKTGELAVGWQAVVDAFTKAKLTGEDALRQARLARILRYEDYPDNEIKLWSPEGLYE